MDSKLIIDENTQGIKELQLNDCDVPINCPWGGDLPGDTCPDHWC